MDNACPASRRTAELEARVGKLALRSKSGRIEIRRLRSQVKELKAQRKSDKSVISKLEAEKKELEAKVKELEGRLKLDSGNSSKPPSSDGLGRKTHQRSLRERTGRILGGQHGHPGACLAWSDSPEHIAPHAVDACPECECGLHGVDGRVAARRQVKDIPPPPPLVTTEHHAIEKVCPKCGRVCTGPSPPGVDGPVQYGAQLNARAAYIGAAYQFIPLARASEMMGKLFNCPMSTGTIVNAARRLFDLTKKPEEAIKEILKKEQLLHVDETPVRSLGANGYIHFAGTERLSHLAFDTSRGIDAVEIIGILPEFKEAIVSDFYPAYDRYGTRHGGCGAHILRELKHVGMDMEGQGWAFRAIDAIMDIKRAVDVAKAAGLTRIDPFILCKLSLRYDAAIKAGARQNKTTVGELEVGRRGAKKSKAANLLARLHLKKERILLSAHDFAVPFDNNLAERGVRMSKVKQKISGCHRGKEGAKIYYGIRSYVDTARKQGIDPFKAILDAFHGNPFMPLGDTG